MHRLMTALASVAAVLVAGLLAAAPATASTVTTNFSFYDSAVTPPDAPYVTGSFSYDSSLSGLLTFADLSAFSITLQHYSGVGTTTYNLAFVQTPQTYSYFGYNATSDTWVPTSVYFGSTPWSSILVAANGSLNNGFWMDALTTMANPAGNSSNNGYYCDYSTSSCSPSPPKDHFVDSFTLQSTTAADSTTPLPGALPLFATGLGLVGLFGLRRKRKNAGALAAA